MKTLFTHNPNADRVCKKSKRGSVLFVILSILLLCLSLAACGGIAGKTDLAPYLSVRYSGYNGNGTAHVDFDFADFEYSIMSGWKGGNNLEKLAELEHIRWMRYHYIHNWKQGKVESGTKDPENRIHADLIPYEELSESEKEKDRENVRILFSLA